MKRRMATIMVGDIVGSTKRMEASEEIAVRECEECLQSVSDVVTNYEGRVFNRQGDALLAEFSSPINALRASMAARGMLPGLEGMDATAMRFGLHIADVMDVDGDLRGDGVNLAARIQAGAAPGTIDVSGTLFDQIERNSPCVFESLGEQPFKGISDPIRIYRVREQLDRHRLQTSSPTGASGLQKRPYSIAVLPFQTASSADEDQRFMAEGITEDLILELGRFRRLFVVSRSASMALATSKPTEVGSELGVRYVLTGSVRRMGSRVRLNVSLAETETGSLLWSERYQTPYEEFFDVMDGLTAKVAATVLGRVENADLEAARLRPPGSLDAYELYLRGIDLHRRGGVTEDNLRRAAHWFEKAIEADPSFARARAMLACAAYGLEGFDDDGLIAGVRRALELDPNDPEANRIMGSVLMYEGEFDVAREYHAKSLRLSPNDAYIIGRCAAFHVFVGEPEVALELVDRAEQLDPFLPVWCTEERISAYYTMGRFEDALDAARRVAFQTRRTGIYRVASRVRLGDLDRARQLLKEAMGINPGLSDAYVIGQEHFQNRETLQQLVDDLYAAGLPKSDG